MAKRAADRKAIERALKLVGDDLEQDPDPYPELRRRGFVLAAPQLTGPDGKPLRSVT
jgi:hypothetical protein